MHIWMVCSQGRQIWNINHVTWITRRLTFIPSAGFKWQSITLQLRNYADSHIIAFCLLAILNMLFIITTIKHCAGHIPTRSMCAFCLFILSCMDKLIFCLFLLSKTLCAQMWCACTHMWTNIVKPIEFICLLTSCMIYVVTNTGDTAFWFL